jgi:hypothetical protein
MQKYFNPLISDPSGIDSWKKTEGRKSREAFPLNSCEEKNIKLRAFLPMSKTAYKNFY